MKRLFALSLMLVALVGCRDEAQGPNAEKRITGTIVAMDANAADFRSITIEEDGDKIKIFIKKNFDYGFDLVHLYEHQDQGLPVSVSVEEADGKLYAVAIDDA